MADVKCRFTGVMIQKSDAIKFGANIPGVHAEYFMANTDEARAIKKDHDVSFHESEANCNTCQNLKRTPHAKRADGFLSGYCTLNDKSLKFHPDDPMFMPCYRSRWT